MNAVEKLPEAQSFGSAPEIKMGKQKILDSHIKRRIKGKLKARIVPELELGSRTQSSAKSWDYTLDNRFFAVQKTMGVCGGEPCIINTRITVRTLDKLHRQGESIEKLAESYNLEPWLVMSAIEYANRNREEIDKLITLNEQA